MANVKDGKKKKDCVLMANVKDGKKKKDCASSLKTQGNCNELHIRHANENILRFTIKEFAIITGLKCTENPNDFQYSNTSKRNLIQRYFPDLVNSNSVGKGRLVHHFLQEVESDDILGFEDFSSKPPNQIVRRSRRVSEKICRSLPILDEEVIEEDNVNQPETTNQFVEPSSPIDKEFVNLVDNPDVEAEEETQVQQHEVLEDDDTLKDKRGNDDVSESSSTVDVSVAGNVSKKVFFADTSNDQQAGEDVSNEVDQRAGENVSKEVIDVVVEFGTKKTKQPNVVQDVADKSQHNIPLVDKVSVNIDTSDSTTSASISTGTQEAIDVLIAGLQTPLCVQPFSAVKSHPLTDTHQSVHDSILPTEILGNEMAVYQLSETPIQ
ncbi:hypothetical protein H5410_047885 [Solanum commersonii]|uniref:DUF1985 domain-containing protein n=1 Tax=Solanum commersonii TaxID=4109 RepID=A0A9J5XGG9_SOLCO|nr:hypothetical protein H5410_047885 [Solanum commersonii]